MSYPNLQNEKKLWAEGFNFIAGIDEAGKGSWAGPIVAGAVILNPKKKISGLRDSKLLTAKARERLYEEIIGKSLAWAAGEVSHEQIDEIGIMKANFQAMAGALGKLTPAPDYLLIDAFRLNYKNLPLNSIISGDYKVASIAAASIIAKVTRDRLMIELDKEFPGYGFANHKGYGTAEHQKQLVALGVCAIHRKSYAPIKNLINRQFIV